MTCLEIVGSRVWGGWTKHLQTHIILKGVKDNHIIFKDIDILPGKFKVVGFQILNLHHYFVVIFTGDVGQPWPILPILPVLPWPLRPGGSVGWAERELRDGNRQQPKISVRNVGGTGSRAVARWPFVVVRRCSGVQCNAFSNRRK